MTQNEMIIELLRDGWLSPIGALQAVGTMKLSTRVSEIRKSGISVEERTVQYTNRFGRKTMYKEYRINERA